MGVGGKRRIEVALMGKVGSGRAGYLQLGGAWVYRNRPSDGDVAGV